MTRKTKYNRPRVTERTTSREQFKDDPQGIANWRLMAAAPELLQSLKMFLHIDPRCHRGVVSCGECAACLGNSAVAKATGE